MLFNKSNNGPAELQQLTGSYYASNSWNRVQTFVQLAEEEMISLLGEQLYQLIDGIYNPEGSGSSGGGLEPEVESFNQQLLDIYRTPIAYEAAFALNATNLVSHEDSGRKVKIDKDNESLAWEWMIDRDDQAHLQLIGKTKDRLINFLEKHQVSEWVDSPERNLQRKLFVNSTLLFDESYPIDQSHAFFHKVKPFIARIQRLQVKPALGDLYQPQLQAWQEYNKFLEVDEGSGSSGGGLPPESEVDHDLMTHVHDFVTLQVMIVAVKRFSLQALPYGVVQQFKSMIQSRNASQAALSEIKRAWLIDTGKDAAEALNRLKAYVRSLSSEISERQILPNNDPANKFFRT